MKIRYAQEKAGQKLHMVPLYGDEPVNIALCGRRVHHWRMTINVPLGHACQNCARINRQNGRNRYLTIMQEVIDWLKTHA